MDNLITAIVSFSNSLIFCLDSNWFCNLKIWFYVLILHIICTVVRYTLHTIAISSLVWLTLNYSTKCMDDHLHDGYIILMLVLGKALEWLQHLASIKKPKPKPDWRKSRISWWEKRVDIWREYPGKTRIQSPRLVVKEKAPNSRYIRSEIVVTRNTDPVMLSWGVKFEKPLLEIIQKSVSKVEEERSQLLVKYWRAIIPIFEDKCLKNRWWNEPFGGSDWLVPSLDFGGILHHAIMFSCLQHQQHEMLALASQLAIWASGPDIAFINPGNDEFYKRHILQWKLVLTSRNLLEVYTKRMMW